MLAFNQGFARRVERPSRQRPADNHRESDDDHALTQTVATALDHIPLNGETIQTNHAVQFRHDQENQRPIQAHAEGVNGGKVGI